MLVTQPPWGDGLALSGSHYSAVELAGNDDALFVLEQRLLPSEQTYLTLRSCDEVVRAIADMVVRGAPAIGIAAAYGMVLASSEAQGLDADAYLVHLRRAGAKLEGSRPTAVNLGWAVALCLTRAGGHAGDDGLTRWRDMAALARDIHRADVAACRELGRRGAAAWGNPLRVMTHCNAGALATGGYGSALGVIRAAAEVEGSGGLAVWACETRPYLQGARLTSWELLQDGIDVTVIGDSMAAALMGQGRVDAIVVGADRIAANGDVANKIGTYGLACLAKHHGVPFYVAAPWSTVDLATADGAAIPIEQRAAEELTHLAGCRLVPVGVKVHNSAFDVTPAALVTAIITERGVVAAADVAGLA